jgi:hypothetical protein
VAKRNITDMKPLDQAMYSTVRLTVKFGDGDEHVSQFPFLVLTSQSMAPDSFFNLFSVLKRKQK